MTLRKSGEPLMIRFVSKMSGDTYDELMVDHIADMGLIFYAGGGSALGAVIGASVGAFLVGEGASYARSVFVIPVIGFVGALAGALFVMLLLNFRGLLRWDGAVIKRTYRLKN